MYDARIFFSEKSPFDTFYETQKIEQILINKLEVSLDAKKWLDGFLSKNTRDLVYKVKSFILRKNYTKESIYEIMVKLAEGDDLYMSLFAKDPKKQNGGTNGNEILQLIYQKKLLEEYRQIKIHKLSSSGKNSYRIKDNKIVKGIVKTTHTTKSLDFLYLVNNFEIFGISKITHGLVTNDKGGAQGNQFELALNDVRNFNWLLDENINKKIIFILDGLYYKNNKMVFDLIDEFQNNKNVYLTTSDGIKEVFRSILHN